MPRKMPTSYRGYQTGQLADGIKQTNIDPVEFSEVLEVWKRFAHVRSTPSVDDLRAYVRVRRALLAAETGADNAT